MTSLYQDGRPSTASEPGRHCHPPVGDPWASILQPLGSLKAGRAPGSRPLSGCRLCGQGECEAFAWIGVLIQGRVRDYNDHQLPPAPGTGRLGARGSGECTVLSACCCATSPAFPETKLSCLSRQEQGLWFVLDRNGHRTQKQRRAGSGQ